MTDALIYQAEDILYGDTAPLRLKEWKNTNSSLNCVSTRVGERYFEAETGWVGTDYWAARAGSVSEPWKYNHPHPSDPREMHLLKKEDTDCFDASIKDFLRQAQDYRWPGLQTVSLRVHPRSPQRVLLCEVLNDYPVGLCTRSAFLEAVERLVGPGSWLFDPAAKCLYLKADTVSSISGMVRCW